MMPFCWCFSFLFITVRKHCAFCVFFLLNMSFTLVYPKKIVSQNSQQCTNFWCWERTLFTQFFYVLVCSRHCFREAMTPCKNDVSRNTWNYRNAVMKKITVMASFSFGGSLHHFLPDSFTTNHHLHGELAFSVGNTGWWWAKSLMLVCPYYPFKFAAWHGKKRKIFQVWFMEACREDLLLKKAYTLYFYFM